MTGRILYERCPLCDALELTFVRADDCTHHPLYRPAVPPLMRWMRCNRCRHVFTDGYFSDETAALVFDRTLEHQRAGADLETQRYVSAQIIEHVARIVPDGAWLDVGFGNGSLLLTAAEWGYEPVGLDLRSDNVAAMRHLGVEAHSIDVTKLEAPGRFSVVSMADVLEHMPFPREGVAAAHRLLREGGVLFASMPNMDSPLWRSLDAQNANPYWGELEHFHNFGRDRLYRLLSEMGFVPVHYGVSHRYRVCMEVIARREALPA